MIELRLFLRAHSRRTRPLVAALQALAQLARLERGCLEAHVFTESNNPRLLYYSEAWDAEDNLRSMLRSERFTHLVELMEMAAEPPSLDFRTIAETQGLEFARLARQGQKKDAFTLDSG
jgi:quinol monooxygenase YgiN